LIEKGNILIHHADDIPGGDIGTRKGCANALQFIDHTIHIIDKLILVFAGLMRTWAEQNQIEVDLPDRPFFDDIDRLYKPLVNDLFFEKK
jgi:hypothetical protein